MREVEQIMQSIVRRKRNLVSLTLSKSETLKLINYLHRAQHNVPSSQYEKKDIELYRKLLRKAFDKLLEENPDQTSLDRYLEYGL